jgi:rhamnosyltransferase
MNVQSQIKSIAGMIVLFQPAMVVLKNVMTYIDQVEKLYVLDNSTVYNQSLINQLKLIRKIEYINNGGNQGIAHALNRGCNRALADGFEWILTMDQDTSVPGDMIKSFLDFAGTRTFENIGILCPSHSKIPVENQEKFIEVKETITSANLLRLFAFKETGGFKEDLFIDYVDHEFCMRLRKKDFLIYESTNIKVIHELGELLTKVFFGRAFSITYHSPLRLYYIVRNGFAVSRMYPENKDFKKSVRKVFFAELGKSLIFYNRKKDSLLAIWYGFIDFKRGRLGAK